MKHDVIAFTTSVAEHVGPDSRFIHYGLTSSDVIDTALALQIRAAGDLLLAGCDARARRAAAPRARAPAHALRRPHARHPRRADDLRPEAASCCTRRCGARASGWRAPIDEAAVGKISGAVGTFAHLDPAVEQAVCARLGIGFESASTQVVQRDRHAAFVNALALVGAVIEQAAVEFRHLARTEVREVEEEFSKGQKGSSAMPHKRNPWRFETLTGLARVLRGYATTALENVALWHERDISNSSVERIVFPDASLVLDFMLHRFAGLVDEARRVSRSGCARTSSRRAGSCSAARCCCCSPRRASRARTPTGSCRVTRWTPGRRAASSAIACSPIPRSRACSTKEEIEQAFDLDASLRNVDAIFARTLERTTREGTRPRDREARRARSAGSRDPARLRVARLRRRAPTCARASSSRSSSTRRDRAAAERLLLRALRRSCSRTPVVEDYRVMIASRTDHRPIGRRFPPCPSIPKLLAAQCAQHARAHRLHRTRHAHRRQGARLATSRTASARSS